MSKVLCLRTCAADGKAFAREARGFQWPASGLVEAPDWDPVAECGHGLHGLLKGEGGHDHLSTDPTALWQVVEVLESDVVLLGDKVKFPRCTVVYSGVKEEAVRLIQLAHPGAAVVWGTATAGTRGTATAGDSGTATAGTRGTATAGDSGTATAGTRGTATAGYAGTATAGYAGTATAGARGTATAGDSGTATAGDSGTATAGDSGTIHVVWWDGQRYRTVTGYPGEGGIEANVAYRLDPNTHLLVRAT